MLVLLFDGPDVDLPSVLGGCAGAKVVLHDGAARRLPSGPEWDVVEMGVRVEPASRVKVWLRMVARGLCEMLDGGVVVAFAPAWSKGGLMCSRAGIFTVRV